MKLSYLFLLFTLISSTPIKILFYPSVRDHSALHFHKTLFNGLKQTVSTSQVVILTPVSHVKYWQDAGFETIWFQFEAQEHIPGLFTYVNPAFSEATVFLEMNTIQQIKNGKFNIFAYDYPLPLNAFILRETKIKKALVLNPNSMNHRLYPFLEYSGSNMPMTGSNFDDDEKRVTGE